MQTVSDIFYVNRRDGWAVAEYTFFERDQIGEARYCYSKRDAIAARIFSHFLSMKAAERDAICAASN